MIIGIGVDIVDLPAWRHFMASHFAEFCCQCFSPAEITRIHDSKDPFLLAGLKFAIKEAVLKAMGTGLQEGMAWTDIEIVAVAPKPKICLREYPQEHARTLGIKNFIISTAVSRNKLLLASALAVTDH